MTDDVVTRPPADPKRSQLLRALVRPGRELAGRASALAGRTSGALRQLPGAVKQVPGVVRQLPDTVRAAPGAVRAIPGALLPLNGRGGDESESVTGYVHGHRMAAGARVARAAVALTFDGDRVRVLQHFGPRVVGWGSFPVDGSQLEAGEVLDAGGLGDTLDDLFDRGGFSRRHVVGAISGRHARSGLLEVPRAEGQASLEAVVAEEASRHLGHVPGESYLFWERAGRQRHTRMVFAVVIPQEPLLLLLEALENAHVRPDSLDLKPLALARAVNQRDAVIASLEPDSLDVVVVADDLPIVVRSAAIPAGMTAPAAREYLVGEVARAIATSRGGRAPLDGEAMIYLAGSRADGKLADLLYRQTGHAIGKLAPPAYYPVDFPVAEQLANVGLALKRD